MRINRLSVMGFAVAMCFAACVQAQPAVEPWPRQESPNRAFSVETPCSTVEVDRLRRVPADISPALNLPPESRVLCYRDDVMMAAGLQEGQAPDGTRIFDYLVRETLNQPDIDGSPASTEINGRRAFVNREVQGGMVAQTGFVELSSTQVVFMFAGGSSSDPATLGQNIDRFFTSLDVR